MDMASPREYVAAFLELLRGMPLYAELIIYTALGLVVWRQGVIPTLKVVEPRGTMAALFALAVGLGLGWVIWR
jgi:hypothetical protein